MKANEKQNAKAIDQSQIAGTGPFTLSAQQIAKAEEGARILSAHGLVYFMMEEQTGKTATSLHTAALFGACSVGVFTTASIARNGNFYRDYRNMTPSPEFQMEVVSIDSAHKISGGRPGEHDLYIIDESHKTSGQKRQSKRSMIIRHMVANRPVIFMSATPTPEKLSQIFWQLAVTDRSPFARYHKSSRGALPVLSVSSFYKFGADYFEESYIRIRQRQVRDYSVPRIVPSGSGSGEYKVLHDISHISITMTRAEMGFSMALVERTVQVPPTQTQMSLYERIGSRGVAIITVGKEKHQIVCKSVVEQMFKQHQIASGTVITDRGAILVSEEKARWISDNIPSGHDFVIFYKYKEEYEVLKRWFPGHVTTQNEFRDKGGIFIGQILACREGINLSRAKHVIFYTIDFAYLSWRQAMNRVQSRTRTEPCDIVFLVSFKLEKEILDIARDKGKYTTAHYKRRTPGS